MKYFSASHWFTQKKARVIYATNLTLRLTTGKVGSISLSFPSPLSLKAYLAARGAVNVVYIYKEDFLLPCVTPKITVYYMLVRRTLLYLLFIYLFYFC
jgi:hypothetical protein